ncbi:MAG: hypothetical protein R3200_07955 [Xanthomonadales bacterium]|nr:hypothetical protein [Xanthomonadales bacterium]
MAVVNDTQEDEILIPEIVVHQLIPVLCRQVRLGPTLHRFGA